MVREHILVVIPDCNLGSDLYYKIAIDVIFTYLFRRACAAIFIALILKAKYLSYSGLARWPGIK